MMSSRSVSYERIMPAPSAVDGLALRGNSYAISRSFGAISGVSTMPQCLVAVRIAVAAGVNRMPSGCSHASDLAICEPGCRREWEEL